ncbi:MAG: LytTR family DNA-binding domain-containing protein [Nannocystaceae bacterium]
MGGGDGVIRALVVDDEAPARAKIRRLLGRIDDVEVVAEAEDGEAAVRAIVERGPDVVFLDVQMPRLDGFEVIERVGVGAMPLVVFVTAHEQHALRAFEVRAFDYLLKPFAGERLLASVARIRDRLAAGMRRPDTTELTQLIEDASSRLLTRITVERSPHRQVLLPVAQIRVVRADKNYVHLITRDARYCRRGTLSALERRLDPEQFLRINRSEIVRLDIVKEAQPWFHGDYRVVLDDGETLTWSRRYRSRQRGRFEPSG